MIAFIPARGGSQRVPRKNVRLLAGHPLLAYTIAAAFEAGCFESVCVSTEDREIAAVAESYGAEVIMRPAVYAAHTSCDVEWLRHAIAVPHRQPMGQWAILRPTSPFRGADAIRRAFAAFSVPDGTHDSLRAVRPVSEHPGKMWTWDGPGAPMRPVFDKKHADGTPWHSSPTQSLPPMYLQTGAIEMGWNGNIWARGTIHGSKVIPFLLEDYAALDINSEDDWDRAVTLAAASPALLPAVALASVSSLAATLR